MVRLPHVARAPVLGRAAAAAPGRHADHRLDGELPRLQPGPHAAALGGAGQFQRPVVLEDWVGDVLGPFLRRPRPAPAALAEPAEGVRLADRVRRLRPPVPSPVFALNPVAAIIPPPGGTGPEGGSAFFVRSGVGGVGADFFTGAGRATALCKCLGNKGFWYSGRPIWAVLGPSNVVSPWEIRGS